MFFLSVLGTLHAQTIVTTLDDEDDGATSLTDNLDDISFREAVNHSASGTTITFDPNLSGQTIELNGSKLEINRTLSVDASSLSSGITIDGGGNGDFIQSSNESRCLLISDGSSASQIEVTLDNIILQNGSFD